MDIRTSGIPYCKDKGRGDTDATRKWSDAVIDQTKHLEKIKVPCKLDIIFYLPKNKYPKDFPYGPDIDNLLKRFFDALNETIFSEIKGKDSCVIELNAKKEQVESDVEAGVFVSIVI